MTWSREQLEQQWRPMVRAARSVLDNRADAEECAAEALLQVLERQPGDVENLQAFMVTVAKRRAVDHVRARERTRFRNARLAAAAERHLADHADEVTTRAEAVWIDAQARRLLKPHVYHLLRRVAEGYTVAEAGALLGMSERAAEGHLGRARALLRRVLARATCVLAVGWGALRRTATATATTTALAAAVLVICRPLPGVFGQHPDPARPDARMQPAVGAAAPGDFAPGAAARLSPAAAPLAPTAAPRPTRRTLAHVEEPVVPGTSTTVEERHHGSGPPDGPVQTLTDCVQNLEVSPSHVGC